MSYLNLQFNQITSIPKEIGNVEPVYNSSGYLKDLNLGDNKLTSIPSEISNIRTMRSLYLYRNNLTSIPQKHMRSLPLWKCWKEDL